MRRDRQALDAAQGGSDCQGGLQSAADRLARPDSTPSARVLAAMAKDFDNSFIRFVRAQAAQTRATLLALPFSDQQQAHFAALSQQSVAEQKKIEASDTLPFEIYREQYVSAARLVLAARAPAQV